MNARNQPVACQISQPQRKITTGVVGHKSKIKEVRRIVNQLRISVKCKANDKRMQKPV